jgi:toxin ParE1/3/4
LTWSIRKSALAEEDLLGIWLYSFEQWNEVQADRYLDELDRGIRLLAGNPRLGVRRDHIRTGYRVLQIERHAIYYTARDSTINIVRILHEQMDPEMHL